MGFWKTAVQVFFWWKQHVIMASKNDLTDLSGCKGITWSFLATK